MVVDLVVDGALIEQVQHVGLSWMLAAAADLESVLHEQVGLRQERRTAFAVRVRGSGSDSCWPAMTGTCRVIGVPLADELVQADRRAPLEQVERLAP